MGILRVHGEDDIPDMYKSSSPLPVYNEELMDNQVDTKLKDGLKKLQSEIHETALSKGWWKDHEELRSALSNLDPHDYNIGPDLADTLFKMSRSALIDCEIAEGIEALRNDDSVDDKLPQFKGQAVELADAIIRIFDLAERFDLPVIDALFSKIEFNRGRAYKHGGKSI